MGGEIEFEDVVSDEVGGSDNMDHNLQGLVDVEDELARE
jgi:hypothetical protein